MIELEPGSRFLFDAVSNADKLRKLRAAGAQIAENFS